MHALIATNHIRFISVSSVMDLYREDLEWI